MSALLSAALRDMARPYVYFVEMDWNGTKERFWTGFGNFDWQHPGDTESRTWYGTGIMGRIVMPEETGEVQVSEMVFEVSGVDDSIRDKINQDIRGEVVTVWLVFLRHDWTVDADEQVRDGLLDRPEWEESGSISTVRVYARADCPFLDTQEIKRWTPEQQKDFLTAEGETPSTDTGFDLMHKQRDNTVAWLPD